MRLLDTALVVGATLRLTRFVTSDSLGDWLLVRPAKRWANRRELPLDAAERNSATETLDEILAHDTDQRNGWRSKLVSGIECPFCVGFWVGLLVLVGGALFSRIPIVRTLWRLVAGALTMNYAVGHISSRID